VGKLDVHKLRVALDVEKDADFRVVLSLADRLKPDFALLFTSFVGSFM